MNLVAISNLFNLLVQESDYFASYHFGYHSDIERNVPNNFDPDGNTGKPFPHVTWAAPPDGVLDLKQKSDLINVELYFYSLQDIDGNGDPIGATWLEQWNTLKARAVEFIHAVRDRRLLAINNENRVEWLTDANATTSRLICVGLKFQLYTLYKCEDYELNDPPLGSTLPAPGEIDTNTDLETVMPEEDA